MRTLLVFKEQLSSFSPVLIHLKTCHEILVLELIGDSCGHKGLVVFFSSSTGKEYNEHAHNEI